MSQKTTGYRPTPVNPTSTHTEQPPTWSASDETDELLDDIDSLLEANELEVVRSFVQRGGQ